MGNLTITNCHIDTCANENVNLFVTNAFENSGGPDSDLDFKLLDPRKNTNYIGINFKEDDKGQIVLYYVYAVAVAESVN